MKRIYDPEWKKLGRELDAAFYKIVSQQEKDMKVKTKKCKYMKGAAWHAAREGKKIVAGLEMTPEKEFKIQAPEPVPTWASISDVKAGLNVMKGIFNNELCLVRVNKIDRGVDNLIIVYDLSGSKIHVLIAEQSQFQKIKE